MSVCMREGWCDVFVRVLYLLFFACLMGAGVLLQLSCNMSTKKNHPSKEKYVQFQNEQSIKRKTTCTVLCLHGLCVELLLYIILHIYIL